MGQSTIDGIVRATNRLIGGARPSLSAATAGAARVWPMRARGMGANVIVTEIDPLPALEAVMDKFEVMPIKETASIGDAFSALSRAT